MTARQNLSAEPAQPGRKDSGVTLSGLRAFVAVAEAMSFSRAAAALGVSQPSVSVQIAGLEAACGVLLLHRRPQLALTGEGRELFVRARLVLSRVEEFDASVRDLRDMQRGHLSIGLSTPHYAMPLVARFARACPNVTLATRLGNTTTLLDAVRLCQTDVAIMALLAPDPLFACRCFAAPRLALQVPIDHPLSGRREIGAADLAGLPVVLREEGSVTRRTLEAIFAAEGVTLCPGLVVGSGEAVTEAVAAGLGIGALFEGTLGPDPRLSVIPFRGTPADCGVYAVSLRESLNLPVVRSFMDLATTRPT